jgi:hypothetical protein
MILSSAFTQAGLGAADASIPPPLIGALLRVPFETVRDRMLAGLHERGFTDLVAAHLDVFQYPGPENQRPLQLATQTRMTKQALNYLLGQLQQLGYSPARPTITTNGQSGSASPPKDAPRPKQSAKSSRRSRPNGNSNSDHDGSRNYATSSPSCTRSPRPQPMSAPRNDRRPRITRTRRELTAPTCT